MTVWFLRKIVFYLEWGKCVISRPKNGKLDKYILCDSGHLEESKSDFFSVFKKTLIMPPKNLSFDIFGYKIRHDEY